MLAVYQIQRNLIHNEIAETERREIDVKAAAFDNRFSGIRADVMILANQNDLQIILAPISDLEARLESRAILSNESLVISREKGSYDQIRFLNKTGREIIRINFNLGRPRVVSQFQLQNKSDRYWFTETMELSKGQIFVSPLDLNVDFGKIEQPLKPTIRFGTLILDDQDNVLGVVAINYLANEFLQELSSENAQSAGDFILLNAEGYWLKAPESEDEWGFMYPDRQELTFANRHPQAWQKIRNQETGQFQTRSGLYTFKTIYPLLAVQDISKDLEYEDAADSKKAESYYWKLISYVPKSVIAQRSHVIREQLSLFFVGVSVLIAIGSLLLVRSGLRQVKSEQQAQELKQTLQDVHRDQTQLVRTAKRVGLNQLVAGIAHEINNPVNFIHGNLQHVEQYTRDVLDLIDLYQRKWTDPDPEIEAEIEEIELDFLQEDLPKLLASMRTGSERIRTIVLSLRNFSRLDEATFKTVDVHEGIESTLTLLNHRLKANPQCAEIKITRKYGELPLVECYAGQLNQVFISLLSNAIDALEESGAAGHDLKRTPAEITIRTELIADEQVEIAITDNGIGISSDIEEQIFDPFFTTKPVGKGTGMGLAVASQIITETHNGQLLCFSTPGQGTQFVIRLPIRL
ncbi:MAG: ATP-binding protein [Leptolyngbyaceae cyanobacterium]